jgi:hypothetical protein
MENNKIDDGGPAFPCPEASLAHFNESTAYMGSTMRDVFAAAALQGICVNVGRNGFGFHEPNKIATECYSLADAMIKARKKNI